MSTQFLKNIICIALGAYFSLLGESPPTNLMTDYDSDLQSLPKEALPEKAIIDAREFADVNMSFFNDPYLVEQQPEQLLVDLKSTGVTDINSANDNLIIPEDYNTPIIHPDEYRDIDFTFFNDPYALEYFNNLPIKAKFGGYLQYSSWWDSRQIVFYGEGYVLLFPEPKVYDVDCNDINARGEYNAGFLETRLRAEFFGPKVLGAESYAYLETDFFGSGIVVNRMRIRHAFMKLTWKPSEILLGQFWNPIFEPRCYPLTLDFGAGEPNATFCRSPQIRYTYANKRFELLVAATGQLDYTNIGPMGPSNAYLRNSRIPMLFTRGAYNNEQTYAGVCLGFKRLVPRLESNTGYRVHEAINSCIALALMKIEFQPLEIRQSIIFSQNGSEFNLLGGYAVETVNPVTDERTYSNLNTLTYWIDFNITRKTEPGLFIGIVKNFGARKSIMQCINNLHTNTQESTIYGLGVNIDTLFRVAPRVRYHALPVDFCAELEIVRAAYGCLNNKARVKNLNPTTDIRLLLTTYYYF